jgi:hypothetical protein
MVGIWLLIFIGLGVVTHFSKDIRTRMRHSVRRLGNFAYYDRNSTVVCAQTALILQSLCALQRCLGVPVIYCDRGGEGSLLAFAKERLSRIKHVVLVTPVTFSFVALTLSPLFPRAEIMLPLSILAAILRSLMSLHEMYCPIEDSLNRYSDWAAVPVAVLRRIPHNFPEREQAMELPDELQNAFLMVEPHFFTRLAGVPLAELMSEAAANPPRDPGDVDEEAPDDAPHELYCIVCKINKRQRVYSACGHFGVCHECARNSGPRCCVCARTSETVKLWVT